MKIAASYYLIFSCLLPSDFSDVLPVADQLYFTSYLSQEVTVQSALLLLTFAVSSSLTDRCENSLASAGVTVVVKENHESIQLTWGNRTASCGQRCCRTSGRTRSSPTTSCRSGTRYGGWTFFGKCHVIVMVLLYFSNEKRHFCTCHLPSDLLRAKCTFMLHQQLY